MITHDLKDMTYRVIFDKYARYYPISFGNRYDDSNTFNAIFELKADLGPMLAHIKDNYCPPNSKENPAWLMSDFICSVQRWFDKNMPGYRYRFFQPANEQVTFTHDKDEELMPLEKQESLSANLLEWIDNSYKLDWTGELK